MDIKDVLDYPNYQITQEGIVFNKYSGRALKQRLNRKTGYLQVSLWKNNAGKNYSVHRLVAIHFLEKPLDKYQVNHKNGIKTNNHVDNLEWVTKSENAVHAIKAGLKRYSTRVPRAVFITYLYRVISGESYLTLSQTVPYKVPFLSVKLRKLAKELEIEHLLDASLKSQKLERTSKINHKFKQGSTTIPKGSTPK